MVPAASPTQLPSARSGTTCRSTSPPTNDPVNGGLTLLTPLVDRLAAAGLRDVTVVTYARARHEPT